MPSALTPHRPSAHLSCPRAPVLPALHGPPASDGSRDAGPGLPCALRGTGLIAAPPPTLGSLGVPGPQVLLMPRVGAAASSGVWGSLQGAGPAVMRPPAAARTGPGMATLLVSRKGIVCFSQWRPELKTRQGPSRLCVSEARGAGGVSGRTRHWRFGPCPGSRGTRQRAEQVPVVLGRPLPKPEPSRL